MKPDLVDLKLEVLSETPKAVRVINLKDDSVWLPKSEIEIEYAQRRPGPATITMPAWLARERELV